MESSKTCPLTNDQIKKLHHSYLEKFFFAIQKYKMKLWDNIDKTLTGFTKFSKPGNERQLKDGFIIYRI